MEEESLVGPLCLFAVFTVLGAAFLFGRDWMARRKRQGLPPIPGTITAIGWVLVGLMSILVVLSAFAAWSSGIDD
jgi:hypothetical protein